MSMVSILLASTPPEAIATFAADGTMTLSSFIPDRIQAMWIALAAVAVVLLWLASKNAGRIAAAMSRAPNWRYVLLVITGLALSAASGWTTWEGMRNFTTAPILSLLITFGIQAILLVVSWLIGESFANAAPPSGRTDLDTESSRALTSLRVAATALMVISGVVLVALAIAGNRVIAALPADWRPLVSDVAWSTLGTSVVVMALLGAGQAAFERLWWCIRTTFANLTLWVMFAACLGASVFFSFDSLFTNIFPARERERVAELHTRARVAEAIVKVGEAADAQVRARRDAVLSSKAWSAYGQDLKQLAALAETAPEIILKQTSAALMSRQAEIGKLQSERAGAQALLDRLESARKIAAATLAQVSAEADKAKAKVASLDEADARLAAAIAAKTSEAEREAGGFGTTGTPGEGPQYRRIIAERTQLEFDRRKLARERRLAEERLSEANERLATAQARLVETTRAAAKQRAATEATEQLLSISTPGVSPGKSGQETAATVTSLAAKMDKARLAFLQDPSIPRLDTLEQSCEQLRSDIARIGALETKAAAQTCSSASLRTATSQLSTAATAQAALHRTCAGANSLPAGGNLDALIAFARGCIATASLPAAVTADLQDDVNGIALARDDKAHRFVVTLNAFNDGNRLAYLALAIALSIDGLVFAAGLFGAYAARSPLSAIEANAGQTGPHLEAIVMSALLPDAAANATAALEHLVPVSRGRGLSDIERRVWTHEAAPSDALPATRRTLVKLLSTGATIGAARQAPRTGSTGSDTDVGRYVIRRELVDFLASVANRKGDAPSREDKAGNLMGLLMVDLAPDPEDAAARIHRYLVPAPGPDGYSSTIALGDVPRQDQEIVRNALNTGAACGCVRFRDGDNADGQVYHVNKDFYEAIASLHAQHRMAAIRSTGEPASVSAGARSGEAAVAATATGTEPRTRVASIT